MEVKWIVVTILVILIVFALLIWIFTWVSKPKIQVVRPIQSGEVIVTGGKSSSRVGGQAVPTSRTSHGSSGIATYRQILGQLA